MSECYLGEIRIWSGVRIPTQWALCNGQALNISQYEALYSLIGTTYGGDGRTTFALPDLRGRLPIGQGQGTGLTNRLLAQTVGAETVALTAATLPAHTHTLRGSTTAASTMTPGPTTVLGAPAHAFYVAQGSDATKLMALEPLTVTANPGQTAPTPHPNMMPATAINYIIALLGLYPQPAN